MSYARKWLAAAGLITVLGLSGCQDLSDDLSPDGGDQRPEVAAGSAGSQVSQLAPLFTAVDSLGVTHTLAGELATVDGVVLYFTMWCPTCDSHMSHIRSSLMVNFPNVTFLIVDYVTGSMAVSRAAQLANGYAGFTVLVDTALSLHKDFDGGMGVTVVIDSSGIVQFNEDYKDGVKVRATLEALP